MSVGGIGARSHSVVQGLLDMRRQLEGLQQQLGTGKKADNYAGMGADRDLGIGLRAQLSALDSYDSTGVLLGVRLAGAQSALSRLDTLRSGAKAALSQNTTIGSAGYSHAQRTVRTSLDEALDLLNTKVGDRYMFAGRDLGNPPVETMSHILDGDGARAGLKQIISERTQADLGSGTGRLDAGVSGTAVSLAEDVAGSPFGFKLVSATTDIGGASVSGPAGSPPSLGIALTANPVAGQSVSITLKLPDGTQSVVKLTATVSSPPEANAFTIGGTPAVTAASLQSALTAALATAAKTSLAAASAMTAAQDFFTIDAGQPPMRVAGPPFATATSMTAGTPSNTVGWYSGELGGGDPRTSAATKVDDGVTVSHGMRANEAALRGLVQNLAVFSAASFDPSDPASAQAYSELTSRLTPALGEAQSSGRIQDIVADLANVQSTIAATKGRHTETRSAVKGLLEDIEGVPQEETAAQILALQTRLQASMQTTATLFKLNLADYI